MYKPEQAQETSAKLVALASNVFGDEGKAKNWLNKKRKLFSGKSAIDLMQSEAGSKAVEEALHQLDEGYTP